MACILATLAAGSARVLKMATVLMLAVLALGGVLLMTRWLYLKWRRPNRQSAGFSLENLEELYASGRISQEEFRRLRRVVMDLRLNPTADKNKTLSSGIAEFDDGTEGVADG